MKLIDLSVPITQNMPVYPGDPKTEIKPAGKLQKDGYEDHYISFGTHAGTHIDAPSHMILNGKTLDQFPLEKFTGRGVSIKIQNKQFDLSTIQSADIHEGDIVLFQTGMSDKYFTKEYFEEYPEFPEEIVHYLIQKKLKMIGIDTCSVDHETLTAHKLFLQNDILIIENLTNLEAIKDKQFTVYAFPLKLSLDGSPVRVVAKIKE